MKAFVEIFRKTVLENPEKKALVDDTSSLTYGELDRLTDRIALELKKLGVQKGDACAILVNRKKEIAVGSVSVLKAGGVFVPMDSKYPADRLEYMMKDASVKVILTEKSMISEKQLKLSDVKPLYFSDFSVPEASFSAGSELLNIKATDDDSAMYLYTSGTTGNPKGVIHRHKMLSDIERYFPDKQETLVTGSSHVAIITSFAFMASIIMEFPCLSKGAVLYIVPAEICMDLAELAEYIQKNKITHIFLPSSMAANMAELYDFPDLNIFAGGEKVRNFTRKSQKMNLINTYGSTEIGVSFTCLLEGNEQFMPVGKPVNGLEAKLTDDEYKPVQKGEIGQLLVSDDRMSVSYLNLPEVTEKHWIMQDGKRWFVTGDRARILEDGSYVILGRNDTMIKIRGYRVEAGEVQSRIADAFNSMKLKLGQSVVVVKSFNGAEHLTCYYEGEKDIDTNKVTDQIRKFLPEYMLPDTWVRLSKMPRNANGKVITKNLPLPEFHFDRLNERCTETERRVVETVCEILNIPELASLDETFIHLGGSSIAAMKVAAALREQGIMVTGPDILRRNRLRDIADNAEVHGEKFWTDEEYNNVRENFRKKYNAEILQVQPLSIKEHDMILGNILHLDLKSRYSVLPLRVNIIKEEDVVAAIDELQKKHELLQYNFVFNNVSVGQKVLSTRKIFFEKLDQSIENPEDLYEYFYHHTMTIEDGGFWISYLNTSDDRTALFINNIRGFISVQQKRYITAEFLKILMKKYPEDKELANWQYIFETSYNYHKDMVEEDSVFSDTAMLFQNILNKTKKGQIPDIAVYSDKPAKKMVFVHTGNTGSDAYYSLAHKIGKDYSFAVIEPYNLYHMEDARYGIENLAKKYVEILKKYQPEGPYILGGWCYGGIVAHEMACQLEAAGEQVDYLIMMDSHAIINESIREKAKAMSATINREYFETTPLFAEIRAKGLLDAMVENSRHVNYDMQTHKPKMFKGKVLYFKPETTPKAASGKSLEYWQTMMKSKAGNYENFCDSSRMDIIMTPHEHDLMMDEESLKIIVPEIYKRI